MIRAATPDDLPFLLSVAQIAYATHDIDWPVAERWTRQALTNPKMPCLRGERSFAFLLISDTFWDVRRRAVLLFFAALPGHDLEPLAVLRAVAAYAKSAGCGSLEAASEVTSSNIGVLLRRIGAVESRRYTLEL